MVVIRSSNIIMMNIYVLSNGTEVSQNVRQNVLETRMQLCDILNDRGGIDAYNHLAFDRLDLDAEDEAYINAYEMLTNACWTKLLNKRGCMYKIISEYFIPSKKEGITYDCVITVEPVN